MKRPLAYIGITSLCAMAVFFYLGYTVSAVTGAVCLAVFLLFLILKPLRRNWHIILISVSVVFSSLYYCCYTSCCYDKIVDDYSGKTASVRATIVENPTKYYGYTLYMLETQEIDGKEDKVKLKLYSTIDIAAQPYDIVNCTLPLYADDSSYSISKGYFLTSQVYDDFECQISENSSKPLGYYFLTFRNALSDAVDKTLPELYAGFAKAIAFCDKYSLDKDIKDQFRTVGLSHIVVVSGLHLSIICGIIIKLISIISKRLSNKRIAEKVTYIFAIIFVFLYAALTGFATSVVRASLMTITMLSAKLISKRADGLNSLGIAAVVMLLLNPYSCGDVGMQLSFAATMGIILLADKMEACLNCKLIKDKMPSVFKMLIRLITATVSVTVSALVFTTPITVFHFGELSLVSLISNLLVTPLVGLVIMLTFCLCVTCFVGFLSPISGLFALLLSASIKYMFWIVGLISKIPFATINIDKSYAYIWLFTSFVIFLILYAFKKSFHFLKIYLPLSALLFLFLWSADVVLNYNAVTLDILPCGTGSTVTVSNVNSTVILSCGGLQSRTTSVLEEIEKSSDNISLMTVTSANKKSSRYAKNIINEFDVRELLLYNSDKLINSFQTDDSETINTEVFKDDYTLYLWNKVRVDIFGYEKGAFMYVDTGKSTLLILPPGGDCENLPERFRTADIIIENSRIKNDMLLKCNTLVISCTEKTAQDILDKTEIVRNDTAFVINEAITLKY